MTTPSRNPANDGDLVGVFREVLRKHLQNTDDMLPARVVSFDRTLNVATVQPLIQMVDTDGNRISRAQVAAIPVLAIGGGNFVLSFPLQAGDMGWVKANDRDISLFLQSYKETAPNTQRMHSFSDAVFIPDVMHGFSINGEDTSNATLQSVDGTQRLSVASSYVKMTSGSNYVKVSGSSVLAQVGTTQLQVTSSGITLTVGGTSMTVSGSGFSSSGTWSHTGVMTANGIGVSTHHHVEHDGPNTSGPVG